MALLTPDQLNPLGSLPGAYAKGIEMRQMLQNAADQHQEFQQRQAQNAQATQWQNITNQMTLQGNSRPVNNGMVADDSAPAPAPQQQPAPAPAPAQNSTPADRPPVPQQPPPVAQAAPIAQPSQPIFRKADPSRTITYTDAQGNKQQRELFTPQEQVQRQIAAKKATEEGTGVPVDIPDATAPGGKRRTYVDPAQYAAIADAIGKNQPMTVGPNGQPSTIGPDGKPTGNAPAFVMPSVTRVVTNENTVNGRGAVADANNTSKEGIAGAKNDTDLGVAGIHAGATTGAATIRANGTVAAAGVRANAPAKTPAGPTPGQTGVQNRFDQKRMDGIGKEEQAYHATRVSVGALLTAGKDEKGNDITPGSRTLLQARYNNATEALQKAQFRKAQVMKTPQPQAEQIAKMPEGVPATSGDGQHIWMKKDGVVYLVK